MRLGRSKLAAIFCLFFFPGFFAETVASVNTPLPAFFSPVTFIVLTLAYGPAALLLRDLWIGRRISAGGVLALGAIYAALNEGVLANVWFEAGALGFSPELAGRWAGINWHLVVHLFAYHTLFSLLAPVLLSSLLFPELNQQALLRPAGQIAQAALLGIGSFAVVLATPSRGVAHPSFLLLLMLVAAIAWVLLAPKKTGRAEPPFPPEPAARPGSSRAAAAGALFTTGFLISFFLGPRLLAGGSVPAGLLLYGAMTALLHRTRLGTIFAPRAIVAFLFGALVPAFLLSFAHWSDGQPLAPGVALLALGMLWLKEGKPKDAGQTDGAPKQGGQAGAR